MNNRLLVDGSSLHEGFSSCLTMWLRLLFGAVLFSLIIYVVIICLYISHIDGEFVRVGLIKGAFRQYLVNRYIYGEIGLTIKIKRAIKVDDDRGLRTRSWRKFNRELEEYLLRVNGGKCTNMIPEAVTKVKKFGIVCGVFSCFCGVF